MKDSTLEKRRKERGWTDEQMKAHLIRIAEEIEAGKHDRLTNFAALTEDKKVIN